MTILRREALQLIASVAVPGQRCHRAAPARRAAPRLGVEVAPDTAPDWWNASPHERETFAFVCDEGGRIDPADPSTVNRSIVQEG